MLYRTVTQGQNNSVVLMGYRGAQRSVCYPPR